MLSNVGKRGPRPLCGVFVLYVESPALGLVTDYTILQTPTQLLFEIIFRYFSHYFYSRCLPK